MSARRHVLRHLVDHSATSTAPSSPATASTRVRAAVGGRIASRARADAARPADRRADRAAERRRLHRHELRRARRRVRLRRRPTIPIMFLKTPNTVVGPERRRRDPARQHEDRLGGRARRRDRQARVVPRLPGRRPATTSPASSPRNDVSERDVPDRGLRRPVVEGQVRARVQPDRPVAGHPGRGRRRRPAAAQLGQRRAASGLDHRRPDLRRRRTSSGT